MSKRALILLCTLLGLLALTWLATRLAPPGTSSQREAEKGPAVTIVKEPASIARRTFDPAAPPADMPPLGPGEAAVCDTNFASNASVAGTSRKTDATHATLTITHVNVTLQLSITIWVPTGATEHVVEHEDGHRQISEYYYQGADKLAEQIAETYAGRQVEISGADLNAESSKTLQQMAADITGEYDKELNPGPTQLLYDDITDHSRNEIVAKDAVVSAINNIAITPTHPATNPGN